MCNKELTEYNVSVFNSLKSKYPLLQLGFFNDQNVLFIGQNPGTPFNQDSASMEKAITTPTDFVSYEKVYERNIKISRIGQVISKIINNKFEKISFTNIVKVPTENNKVPAEHLVNEFLPITYKQVELLKPKLIVCLGRFAGQYFNRQRFYSISKYSDSVYSMMIPHPSFILRNGQVDEVTKAVNKIINNFIKQYDNHYKQR